MGKYDDIIDYDRPIIKKHTRMDIYNRAKIFAPFAALTGYEAAIENKKKIVVAKKELNDELTDQLNERLIYLSLLLENGEQPIVTVIYYQIDKDTKEGEYIKFTGKAVKLDISSRIIQIVDRKISLDDIRELMSDEFSSIENRMA